MSFTKSYNGLQYIGILLGIMLTLTALTTEMFTAFPDFEGGAKAIAADLLIIPSTLGVFAMLIVFFRFPKHIQVNEANMSLKFDGRKIDNPVEVTIQSNQQENERFMFIVYSNRKQKLKTGFLYKINSDQEQPISLSSGKAQITLVDK